MNLDLLYEVDAPKPWGAPHPRGQRERERRAYDEAIEQIVLGDSLGYNTSTPERRRTCTTSRKSSV